VADGGGLEMNGPPRFDHSNPCVATRVDLVVVRFGRLVARLWMSGCVRALTVVCGPDTDRMHAVPRRTELLALESIKIGYVRRRWSHIEA
jgi:hypothetical protein